MTGTHNQSHIASFFGKQIKAIRKYEADGVIQKEKNGKYDPSNCAKGIISYLGEIAGGRKSESGGLDITVERSRLAKEQADKVARENAEASGELLPRGEVEAGILNVLSNVRTRLLAMPAKLGPEVAIKKTAAECADILTGGVYDCLEEVSEIEITRNLKISIKCESCGHAQNMLVDNEAADKVNRVRVGRSKKKIKSGSKRRAGKVANK